MKSLQQRPERDGFREIIHFQLHDLRARLDGKRFGQSIRIEQFACDKIPSLF